MAAVADRSGGARNRSGSPWSWLILSKPACRKSFGVARRAWYRPADVDGGPV